MFIAQNGYTSVPGWTVFLPFYPLLIKVFSFSGLNFFWSGFLISQLSLIGALFFLFKLLLLDFDISTTKRVLMALLIFPSSFYLGSVYSESLFLAVTIAAFYYARKKKWLFAALLAGFASITRLVGVGVVAAIFIEYLFKNQPILNLKFFSQNRLGKLTVYLFLAVIFLSLLAFFFTSNFIFSGTVVTLLDFLTTGLIILSFIIVFLIFKFLLKHLDFRKLYSVNFVFVLFSLVPFSAYLVYQQTQFGSALTFIHSESAWGRGLMFPGESISQLLERIFLTPLSINEYTARVYIRFLSFLLAAVCLVISYYKLRLSYTVFYLAAFLIPLFSGTIADFTRYILVVFPMFIILGFIKNELIQKLAVFISILLLSLFSILYINSYFFI